MKDSVKELIEHLKESREFFDKEIRADLRKYYSYTHQSDETAAIEALDKKIEDIDHLTDILKCEHKWEYYNSTSRIS
jgi:hypothetical protein